MAGSRSAGGDQNISAASGYLGLSMCWAQFIYEVGDRVKEKKRQSFSNSPSYDVVLGTEYGHSLGLCFSRLFLSFKGCKDALRFEIYLKLVRIKAEYNQLIEIAVNSPDQHPSERSSQETPKPDSLGIKLPIRLFCIEGLESAKAVTLRSSATSAVSHSLHSSKIRCIYAATVV